MAKLDKIVGFRLSDADIKKVKKEAATIGITFSTMLRILVKRGLSNGK